MWSLEYNYDTNLGKMEQIIRVSKDDIVIGHFTVLQFKKNRLEDLVPGSDIDLDEKVTAACYELRHH